MAVLPEVCQRSKIFLMTSSVSLTLLSLQNKAVQIHSRTFLKQQTFFSESNEYLQIMFANIGILKAGNLVPNSAQGIA